MLDEQRDEFMAALDRVRGCDELGARIVVDRALVRQAAGRTTPPETPSGSGTAYLAERQRQRGADDDARRLATIIGDEAHAVFAELATDARRRPPQDPRLSGESAWMILNGAYLVPRDRHEAFHRLADDIQDRCAAAGTVVTLTGPWAPYNFVAQSEHAS
jgi:hypothetical protein